MVLDRLPGLRAALRVACHVLACGCLAILLTGCQGGPRTYAYIEAMNAERRGLEDRVYELEYELEMLGSEVDHYRDENSRLRRQLNGEDSGEPANSQPPRRTRTPSRTPSVPRTLPPDDLAPPRIDTGDPAAEAMAPPSHGGSPARSSGRADPGAPEGAAPAELPPPATEAPSGDPGDSEPQGPMLNQSSYRDDRDGQALAPDQVASIALDPRLTGGVDLDDAPGDDGVTVAVELKDARGRLVSETGPVSVVVVDPQLAGPAARVARWDLDADQVLRLLPDRRDDESLVLHMAWPGAPPANKRLRLFVRYQTADGRKLDAQRDIEIRLPADSRQTRAIPAAPARPVSPNSEFRSDVRPASAQQPADNSSSASNVESAGWRARIDPKR